MSIWDDITKAADDVVDGLTDAEKAAEKAAKDAANAAAKAAEDAANAVAKAAEDAANAAAKAAQDAADVAAKAAQDTIDAANKAAQDVIDATNAVIAEATTITNNAIKQTSTILNQTADEIVDGTNAAIATLNNTVLEPVQQASVDALNDAAEAAKIAGDDFDAGLKVAAQAIEKGAVQVEEGLVAIGEYLSSHACSIALGAALTGAFAATLNNPETEAETTAMFAPMSVAVAQKMIVGAAEDVACAAACRTVAASMVEIVWVIPEVKKGVGGHKDDLIGAVAFTMSMVIDDSPYAFLSPQTASLAVAGIVSFIVSSLVCDGTLPGM